MATKTFNIGEYAVGGRIKVTIQGDVLTIDALSWNTKQLVSSQTFHKKTDWDGKTHFEGRPIDNFLNDLTSSYYAGKIMDWIKEKTEVKFAQGGNIDKEIKAKPRGWRFSGENNYKRPTPSERGTRGTYFEARRNRSDKDLRKRLEEGGKTEKEMIGNWEQTFIAHKKYPSTITEKVEELESKDSDLESDLQDKADDNDLDDVKSTADNAESNIDDVKDDVGELESRIETMEGKVSDLEDNMPEMAQGGNIDKDIKAKPRGYRFVGKDNYRRPLVSERGRSDVYFEARRNRSDKNLRKKLEEGGDIQDEYIDTIQQAIAYLKSDERNRGLVSVDTPIKWSHSWYDKFDDNIDTENFETDEQLIEHANNLLNYEQEEQMSERQYAEGGQITSIEEARKFVKEDMNEWGLNGAYEVENPEKYAKWVITHTDEDGFAGTQIYATDEEFIKYAEQLRKDWGDEIYEEEEGEQEFAKGGIIGELNKKYSFTDLFR